LKDEAIDLPLWRTGFGRGYGTVVRQTKERMKGTTDFLTDVVYLTRNEAFQRAGYQT
jgi:hypothetical protein